MSFGSGKKPKGIAKLLVGGSGVSRAVSKAIGIPSLSTALYNMANPEDPADPSASADANKVVPLPDPTNDAVRKRQADELKSLLSRRGASRTLLSGRAGDQSATATRRPTLARA